MTVAHGNEFRHEAFFYAGEQAFLAGTVPFLRDAVRAGEPVMVAVRSVRARALEEALDGEAEHVRFVDMEELGRNPARIIPAWRDFVEANVRDGGSVRGVGEPIWPGRSSAEVTECEHHESLLNLAFADSPPFWLLCPYDTETLGPQVLDGARRNHPLLAERDTTSTSDAYLEPRIAPGPFTGELPPPSSPPDELTFESGDLHEVRAFVAEQVVRTHLGVDRMADLVLAVSEVATNSVLHAEGRGTVRMWREEHALVCEVCDGGRLVEPLLGRTRPAPDQTSGRGLWLVNQLCDLVQMRTSPSGSVVRLHMRVS